MGQIAPDVEALRALGTGPEERIYVAGEDGLVVYGLDGAEVARVTIDGRPNCLAVAPDGEILLGMRTHVVVLGAGRTVKSTWDEIGGEPYITSIAADSENVYVADAGNRVVLRYDRTGKLLGRIGEKDVDRGIPGFILPSPCFDVAFDNRGSLWVANTGRHGLENYRSNGDLMASWYRPSISVDGFCGCCNPSHIAFRSDGSLVTTEKGLARIKLFSVDQKLIGFVADPRVFEETPEGVALQDLETRLQDLAVDARDRVLVLDSRRNVIRIFEEREQG
jgi:sugar lactone lactonase YvrE